MPRPKSGYKNAAGLPVPATGDINGRFMDRRRLLYWAYNRGKQGHQTLYDDSALDIGTAVHMMAELDLKERPQQDIDFYLTTTLPDSEQQKKAKAAFAAFRQWKEDFYVVPIEHEVSLVSEAMQFGGTLDTVALVRNRYGLVDFKTTNSGEVYEDHILQLAAYGILWTEKHPAEQLDGGYHLILLPKDGSKPIHREFTHDQLHPFRQKFWLYRKAYDFDLICNDAKTLLGAAVAPSPKPAAAKAATKPRARVATPPRELTMAEILRSYGHVKEQVATL